MEKSAPAPSSPRASPVAPSADIDEDKLPNGRCRYILLNPEIKGQRCGCVAFTLNSTLPGVSCQCGHLSCFHIKATEPPPHKREVDELRRRVMVLEGQLDRENDVGLGSALRGLIRRLGEVEEQVEKNKEEASLETRDCYRNVALIWQTVSRLEKRQSLHDDRSISYDERIDSHDDALQRLGDRLMEFDEAAIELEERVEVLEDDVSVSLLSRQNLPSNASTSELSKNLKWTTTTRHQPSGSRESVSSRATVAPVLVQGSWTVHVSLLPTATQPFPFEKDTNAYKRCLSRGLHQMIAVGGADATSFGEAVSRAFGSLLQGREWVPLQARLCDAETLEGLPMLRPLDSALVGANYDLEFLRKHCAVCSPSGKVESLYIALRSDTFSWRFLRRSPCHLEGLEASWQYDPLLDPDEKFGDEDDRPSAGDIMPSLPNLKRTASEMSRTTGFGTTSAAVDGGEGNHTKLPRTTRMVETV